MANDKVFSATIFFPPETGIKPRKYQFVRSLPGFIRFAGISGAIYVNLYEKPSGAFLRRIWL